MNRNPWLRILSLITVISMCFSFVACESSDVVYENNRDENIQDEVQESLPSEKDNNDDDRNNLDEVHESLPVEKDDNSSGDDDADDKNVHSEVNELLTLDELIDFHLNGAKYPDNFVFEELSGYERVIESASSREDALSTAAEHFNSGWCTTEETRLEVETDLFYGLYVKWAYRTGGVGKPESYYDEYVVSFKKDVYDSENMQFFTKDTDDIKSILDYIFYSESYQTGGTKVYSSDIILENDKCTYTAYVLMVVYGDWGLQDELNLLKTQLWIDLATGKTTYHIEEIGTAYIDGACTHGPVIID